MEMLHESQSTLLLAVPVALKRVRDHVLIQIHVTQFTNSPTYFLSLQASVDKADVDLWELNEAFSVVAVANCRLLELDPAIVNICGGGVSLGHPLGCSGARILVTLIAALRREGKKVGCAALCNGGGGASAMVVRREGTAAAVPVTSMATS